MQFFCDTIAISHETSPMKCSRFIQPTSFLKRFLKTLLCSGLLCEFLPITLLFHRVSPFSIKLSYQNFRQPQFRKAQPTNIAQVLQDLVNFFLVNFCLYFLYQPQYKEAQTECCPCIWGGATLHFRLKLRRISQVRR